MSIVVSNEDQRMEIEALESIFSGDFSTSPKTNEIKVVLSPHLIPDETHINHITSNIYIIMGHEYPQNPLYRIVIELFNVNEEKLPQLHQQFNTKIASIVGDAHNTILDIIIATRHTPENDQIRQSFQHEARRSFEDPSSITNANGISTLNQMYIYELIEAFREVLLTNNVKEVLSLRDMVDGIEEHDLKMSQQLQYDEEEEEESSEDDPYEEDYIFVPEFDSAIEIGDDENTTAESFERWNNLFLAEQAEFREKIRQGRIEEKLLPSGKQLFLQNMVTNLFDDIEDGSSAAFTFVKSQRQTDDDDDGDSTLVSQPETVEINESLFAFDDDDDDDLDAELANANAAAAVSASTPTPTTEQAGTTDDDIQTDTTTAKSSSGGKSSSAKQKSHEKSDSKPGKDAKKEKKGEKDSKKRDKKDSKSKPKKDDMFGFSGGFSEFLGEDFSFGGDEPSKSDKKKSKK